MLRLPFAICLALVLACNLGCGSGKPETAQLAPVKGVINMDGKPIPTGEIHFSMPGVPPKVLEIKNGAFSGEAPVGKDTVEVFVYAETAPSEKEKYGGARTKTNTIPNRYWGPNSTLTATVSATEPNDLQFALTSQGGGAGGAQGGAKDHHSR